MKQSSKEIYRSTGSKVVIGESNLISSYNLDLIGGKGGGEWLRRGLHPGTCLRHLGGEADRVRTSW